MPLITISYNIGCDGDAIAKLVANGLDLELYDNAKIQNMAMELGVSELDLINLEKKTTGFLNHLLSKKPQLYFNTMEAVIQKIAARGQGVIIGHGSQFLLQDIDCAFHVKIQSKTSRRVKRLMDQQGLSLIAAQTLLKKADEQHKSFLKYAFYFDVDDPNIYDLVINREKIGKNSAAKIIIDSTGIEDLSECSLGAYQAMERLALEKNIRARLLDNHIDLSTLNIEVTCDGSVHISGMASSEADKERLPHILRKMPTVERFDIEVTVWLQSVIG